MKNRLNSKVDKAGIFMFIISCAIVFFTSFSLNDPSLRTRTNNIDYAEYPIGYSVCYFMNIAEYENGMKERFNGLSHEPFYLSIDEPHTNIQGDDFKIKVFGSHPGFEKSPLPSVYSDTIVTTELIEGKSFDNADILTKSGSIIMYESHLAKIGYKPGDELLIDGTAFTLKGVLKDNADVKRNLKENMIQIFMPYSTFFDLFSYSPVKAVIYTGDYVFPELESVNSFLSYNKVLDKYAQTKNYLEGSTRAGIVGIFAVSFIATIIIQVILMRGRYLEIGIRRTVGASRDDVIFMFTKRSLISFITGAATGTVAFLLLHTGILIAESRRCFTNLFIYDLKSTVTFTLVYIIISYIGILVPAIIGTNINISSVLVEEKVK